MQDEGAPGSLLAPTNQGPLFPSQLQSLEQEKGRWRVEKAQLEQSVEENKERMEKLEGYWGEAQSLCQAVDEHLRETQAQYQALERKYSKAKRLIKDYQQKYVALGLGAGDPGPREAKGPVVAVPPHPQPSREVKTQRLESPVAAVPGPSMTRPQGHWEHLGTPDLRTGRGQGCPVRAEDRVEDPDTSWREARPHPLTHRLSPHQGD